MRANRRVVCLCAWLIAAGVNAPPATAFTTHRAVTLRGAKVDFYAGHLVLDASGGATLDDGGIHVTADRIIVDLGKSRCIAAGDVTVTAAGPFAAGARGVALGADLATDAGTLVVLGPTPGSVPFGGVAVAPSPSPSPSPGAGIEPLDLVDLQGETPFAQAAAAVAHLGADVRLRSARVLVPGGKDVYIPSYVYTFSSDVGYSQSNVSGGGEDVPIFFGSTRDSVTGAHFTYNAVTKVGVGIDHRIVDGDKAYDLFSVSPLSGPSKNAQFTWQEQINGHSYQNLNAGSSDGSGSNWNYDVNDSIHRSFFDLRASTSHFANGATLAWQGAYEPLGPGWLGNTFNFHLRSEYGRSQSYLAAAPPIYHTAVETEVQAPFLTLDPSTSLSLQADWRETFDNQPHREFGAVYGATLAHQWNRFVSTSLTDLESPTVDYYPSFDFGSRTYVTQQVGSLSYSHGDALSFTVDMTHAASASTPAGFSVQPWSAFLDVRFRASSSLAFDLSRSYGFGYNGQRFGSLGFQIFP
jgi:hypothetical protein